MTHLTIFLIIHPPIFLSVCPSFHPSNIQPSIQHPTIHSNRTIHSSILLCIHPSYKYILYQLWTRHCSRRDMHAELLQPCPTLGNPLDCSPPGSSVHGILQARTLEWVAMPSSRRSSRPRDRTHNSYISCIGRRVLYHYRHLRSPLGDTVVNNTDPTFLELIS